MAKITRGTVVPPASTLGRVNLGGGVRSDGGNTDIEDVREQRGDMPFRKDEKILAMMGSGIAYPFEFSPGIQGVSGIDATKGKDKINQSIFLILSTRPGERFFNPQFGSRLPLLVFEPVDEAFKVELELETRGALERWEPRIRIVACHIIEDEFFYENGQIGISIEYVLRNSNIKGNYVYPFQLAGEPVT